MTADGNTPRVTAKGVTLAIIISIVSGLVLSELLLRVVMPDWREFYSGRFMESVTLPGHSRVMTGRPGFDGYFAQNNGDFRIRISLNPHGHRNAEPAGDSGGQIWVVGDSMTFGWGVAQAEMYSEVLETRLGVPVYNLASPGTDICGYQSMLARMPSNVNPRAVIVGLVLENDVRLYDCVAEAGRNEPDETENAAEDFGVSLLEVKQFATRNSALYNFFAVALKRVAVVHHLLVSTGILKKPHSVNRSIAPEMLPRLTASTVKELVRLKEMLPTDTPFTVMVAPTRFEIRDGTPIFEKLRRTIVEELLKRGIPAVDPFAPFKAAGFGPTHFRHDGHWSALGHKIAADAIARHIKMNN